MGMREGGREQTYVQIHCLQLIVLLKGLLSQLRHLEHEGQTLLQPTGEKVMKRKCEAVTTPSFSSWSRAPEHQ